LVVWEVTVMGGIVVIGFIVLVGPLSIFLGADSRIWDDKRRRGWWPARPRYRNR
jgi:hypothetical protein